MTRIVEHRSALPRSGPQSKCMCAMILNVNFPSMPTSRLVCMARSWSQSHFLKSFLSPTPSSKRSRMPSELGLPACGLTTPAVTSLRTSAPSGM